jgi:type IV secretory pathway VirB10-like protein
VAARAAMIQSAQKDMFLETSEGGPKTPKRSWAQVVSGQIKEEEPVDGIATLQKVPESNLATSNRHDEPPKPSVQNRDEKVVQSKVQTWAEVASAKWIEKQSKKQQSRNRSFGKSNFKVGQYKFELKDVVNIKVKEEPKEDRYHNLTANPAKQKALPVEKGTGKNRRVCGNEVKTWMWKY